MSTLHISPLDPDYDHSIGPYLRDHRGHLSRSELEYVSLAGGYIEPLANVVEYDKSEAYAEIHVGGSLVTVKPAGSPKGHDSGQLGAARGEVLSYSSASRRRLMRMIARVDRDARPIFVTLTYPDLFSDAKEDWKRDLDAFGKRFRRKFDNASFVWRIEFQDRKSGANRGVIAPHFHLLVWGVDILEFRRFVSRSWHSVVGTGDERHLRAGTSAERLKSFNGTMRYVSKYLAKEQQFPDGWQGRVWGVVGRDSMPYAVRVVIPLTDEVAIRLVRLGRKMLGMVGKTLVFGLTWIVNAERVLDYIEWAEGFL